VAGSGANAPIRRRRAACRNLAATRLVGISRTPQSRRGEHAPFRRPAHQDLRVCRIVPEDLRLKTTVPPRRAEPRCISRRVSANARAHYASFKIRGFNPAAATITMSTISGAAVGPASDARLLARLSFVSRRNYHASQCVFVSNRMPRSRPSSVSGNMRSPINWRVMRIDS